MEPERARAIAAIQQIGALHREIPGSGDVGERELMRIHVAAHTAADQLEDAIRAIRHQQNRLSMALAQKTTLMDGMALISCLMAAVLAILFRSFQQTTAVRFNMQEELEKSEDQFRALFEDAPVAYHEMDREGIVQRVNRAECALLGCSPRQILGQPIWNFIAESCRESTRESLRSSLASAGAFTPVETEFVREDGAVLNIQMHACVIRNSEGEVTGTRATLLDITDRKKAEQAQRESISVLNATLEATADGILVVDRKGNVVSHNRRFLALWRIPESISTSRDDNRLLQFASSQVADQEEFRRTIEKIYSDPSRESFDSVEFPDGRVFERCSRPQQIGQEIVGRVWSFRDVTSHRNALHELKASEERWQLAVRGSNDGLFDWDAQRKGVYYSTRWKEMLGFEEAELPNTVRAWRKLVHPEDAALVKKRIREHFARKTGFYTAEYRLRAKDGSYRWILARGQALWDEAGRPTRLVGSHKDVTERRMEEEALRIAKNEAECASRAKGEFLANMSHEIRTPMTGVLGMIDLVLSTPLAGEQRDHLEIARASADSLLKLLNDILDVSKIEAGRLELSPTDFSIRQSVGDAMRMFAVRAEEKHLSFTTHVDSDVPDLVVGDPLRLRQILVNLVGNAIKFTEEGFVSLAVRTQSRRAGSVDLLFEVTDTGLGIPLEKQKVVFDPFRQLDGSSKRRHFGTGLGLTISSSLVELLGGKLEVRSQPGRGSTFFFALPFAIGAAPAESTVPPAPAPEERPAAEIDKRRLRILVAEDNIVNQKLATILLRKEGHEVVVVGDGRQAVEATTEAAFDLVFMDVQMPAMDGFEATAAIRRSELESGRHLPIVAMTAHAMKGDQENCLAAGMDDYVSKPFNVGSLRAVLERHGNAHSLPRFPLPVQNGESGLGPQG